ncbi:MAG: dTDP-4-dehydrorhamnose reductase [Planctomycetes bacterium]|nr:dTDP-4-dehydrorhamnose reductase [Planctomycetota bacterium]
MKYAVIGSAGQLGRALCPLLPGDVIPLVRQQADLEKPTELKSVLETIRPDVVVNCSAYNLVDRAETEPEAAFAVNAWGVRALALACRSLDATLVHFSTDYVFGLDTTRRTPWKESDAPGPASAYGLSKLTGEYWARQICPKHFVIRTCGLYGSRGTGGKGGNFVETMLRVAGEGKPLRVVDDQRCTPSYVGDVAAAVIPVIATDHYGLYHLTNSGSCSWYEFAREIFQQAGLQPSLTPIPSRDYPTPARRPAYSVLARDHADAVGLPPMRSWQEGLAEYLRVRRIL